MVTVKITGAMKTTWSASPIPGSIQRQGAGSTVACGEDMGVETGPCVGKKAFDTNAQFAFGANGSFTVQDNNLKMTTELYQDCNWVWNLMVVRTGAVLINFGTGKFDTRRLANGRSSVSLKSHKEERCEDESGNTPGVRCTTVTDWRVTLYPDKTKKRGR